MVNTREIILIISEVRTIKRSTSIIFIFSQLFLSTFIENYKIILCTCIYFSLLHGVHEEYFEKLVKIYS